jgi:hypothetical protein
MLKDDARGMIAVPLFDIQGGHYRRGFRLRGMTIDEFPEGDLLIISSLYMSLDQRSLHLHPHAGSGEI